MKKDCPIHGKCTPNTCSCGKKTECVWYHTCKECVEKKESKDIKILKIYDTM